MPIAGYADDLALYLNGPEEEAAFLAIVHEFGRASGLQLNEKNCVAVCLHPNAPNAIHEALRIKPQPRREATGYLGIPLRSLNIIQSLWDQVIRATLQWQGKQNTDPVKGARLISAIAILKFLFVARHSRPTRKILHDLESSIHNFIWTGLLSVKRVGIGKASLNQALSQRSTSNVGVGAPSLRRELTAMAAGAVEYWNNKRKGISLDVSAALIRK